MSDGFGVIRINIGVPLWVYERLKRLGEEQPLPKKPGYMATLCLVNYVIELGQEDREVRKTQNQKTRRIKK